MTSRHILSIVVFGSRARGTTDSLSDRDVLIVTNSISDRDWHRSVWNSRGWSVVCYSPSRFKAMAKHGSLFVQHLRLEGLVVIDKDDWLANEFQNFQTKQDYRVDIEKSFQLLRPVERVNDSHDARLMYADVMYVFLRNFGICTLANVRDYCFEYKDIVDALSTIYKLRSAETKLLHKLRHLKGAYRDRKELDFTPEELRHVYNALIEMSRVTDVRQLAPDAPVRLFDNRYATIRDLEARLLTTFNLRDLDSGNCPLRIKNLWKIVMQPRGYSWAIKCIDEEWIAKLNRGLPQSRKSLLEIGDYVRPGSLGHQALS